MKDPKRRFSNRAENYARHRPGYPQEAVNFLSERCSLTDDSVVADVGAGTGIVSALFLKNGNRVYAVEPNPEMREAAERALGDNPCFQSVDGAAEDTTLADESVDLIVVANALHWVEAAAARVEFSRILKPGGRVAILWNVPCSSGTPFLEAYADLMATYRTDGGAGEGGEDVYANIYANTDAFFDGGSGERQDYEIVNFPYYQSLNLDGLRGLTLSASNMPFVGEPGSARMLGDLEEIFRANEREGRVVLEYKVSVYCGTLL